MAPVVVGALLFAAFLIVVAALLFQEVRRGGRPQPTYVLDEVVPYAFARLSERAAARLDREDVKRILEWEVFYLQGLAAQRGGDRSRRPVAGSDEAVSFIVDRSSQRGTHYEAVDVAEILYHEGSYLAEIGAIGPPVAEAGT